MKTYWTTKSGQTIDVDLMDCEHLRNTLKMIIQKTKKNVFHLHGNIAKQFNEAQEMDELFEDLEGEEFGHWYNNKD